MFRFLKQDINTDKLLAFDTELGNVVLSVHWKCCKLYLEYDIKVIALPDR